MAKLEELAPGIRVKFKHVYSQITNFGNVYTWEQAQKDDLRGWTKQTSCIGSIPIKIDDPPRHMYQEMIYAFCSIRDDDTEHNCEFSNWPISIIELVEPVSLDLICDICSNIKDQCICSYIKKASKFLKVK